ncbi:leucyl aminopeptidase [Mycena metata]|uniref:Aminopeptidase n=1 Tax=Mycena metata TaxID=1033252 RepID=A0AAD7HS69_9AGAR|nr:leucyl aminopeptidase [Mycena metata]
MSSDLSEFQENKYRLPTNVKPSHYDLTFWTDLKSLEFGGLATIDLDILRETSAIVLNCADTLSVTEASIHCAALETNQVQAAQIVIQENLGRVTLNFLASLPAGSKAQLKLKYNAKLSGSMVGYYKSAWKNGDHTEYYAMTQFQPIDARAAFPCWDEPLLKATWSITMISRSETVNISNMAVESEALYNANSAVDATLTDLLSTLPKDAQWKTTKFQKSPPMSSYLVAFANGPLAYLEKSIVMPLSGRTVPLRVYGKSSWWGEFCLEVTAKVLPLYEQIFDIEYPLPKLDIMAAHDFDIGAMENWGLITGRTRVILLDPKKADIVSRKMVARIVSHEVAHMWFGNITTMEWWDYLYLNEGPFTRSLAWLDTHRLFPEWEVKSNFVNTHLYRALSVDAKRSSHPIEVECPDANFINQIFDGLSYSKAAAVLRMLSEYVGEEQFLKGVSVYLKNHLYGNSVTRDLWDGISAETGQDIPRLMNDWVSKIGFPLITVTETSNGIHVRQDRFLNDGTPETEENKTIWNVPLRILTVENDGQVLIDNKAILDGREKTLPIDTTKTFKLNAGTVGFYRVLYIPERLSKIATEAAKANSVFSLSDRIGLMYDVAALANAGLAKLSTLLTLTDIWRNEQNCKYHIFSSPFSVKIYPSCVDMVWSSVLTNMGIILSAFWEHPQIVDSLRAFISTLYAPLVARLGYEFPDGESVDIVLLRKAAVSGAALGRDESVARELRRRFADYLKTGNDAKIPSNLRLAIYTAAVRYGGREEFDALIKIIENPAKPASKSAAITAIGKLENLDLAEELFSYILNGARDQDVVGFCQGLAANALFFRRLAQFFKDNYDGFVKRFGTNSMLKYLVTSGLKIFSRQVHHLQGCLPQQFPLQDKDTSRYSMGLAQGLETIRSRIVYIERSSQDLSQWLTEWEQGSKL